MNSVPKIRVCDLHKSFARPILQGVSFDVQPQESLVVIGGSGTGKSVLLKAILGLISPDAGSISIDGNETVGCSMREREQWMRRFGMLFQGGALFDSLTVWENITFAVRQRQKMSKAHAIEKAIEKLKSVGLKQDVALQYPSQLSGGMQKRVALARAICGDPDIIFFDEPTTGLDPIMAEVINELIVSCCKEIGATAITITHDMHSARTIADRIAMLYQGQLIWHGHAADVMDSGNPYVDQFVHGRSLGPIE
ncbi:MAG: ATP-binding cassette domain-containing protein [Alphaproteobacteria bacterium]|nr:MAG: ATP-binding cassette domain-containing protein [Alphaproteobacteria bacterium]TAF15850.1 MAG: ATP-binding cassette domain-containing protein [Alphaproteobacteria bacterium]TAF41119.1 MAG: ATP-binding cassette domain-containing protein [Alphaproteobacteria bacterium]TAF77252.1 MAG: ATP-binding cassette domain-containing protein [Alphaproteobacteria bacterium]